MRRTDRDPFPSSPKRSSVRRRLTLAAAFAMIALGMLASIDPARAATPAQVDDDDDPLVFDVIQVSGLLDGIVADFIEGAIDTAEDNGSGGLILQVNSGRAVVPDDRIVELADRILESDVPVYAWVGPSGAKAERRVAQLLGVADELAVAIGARFGNLGELVIPEDRFDAEFLAVADALADDTVDGDALRALGFDTRDAPTLGFFTLGEQPGDELPGFSFREDDSGDETVRVPVSPVRFTKLSLFDGWMHTFASPAMAYLLFLVGAALLIFEFFTAGVGIAGVVGAVCFVLGCYGFDVLPVRWWALALLVIAMLGYAIDVQTGVPRAWSAIATVCLVLGSLFLYEGLSLSWITLVAGVAGISVAMVSGMPAMVRTRFGTPTIGREWMIGAMGTAAEEIKKEGVVLIDGAPWRARVNRTTPIPAGDPVRVVAIEGLFLEIEPEEGGARDYREMRKPR